MGFTSLDAAVVLAYLVGTMLIGVLSSGKQATTHDYFLGGRSLPWWAVCVAIVATETSSLTFISIPGLAYVANLNFFQVTLGYLLGRIAVSVFLLPEYARGELVTAYELLERRFGAPMRKLASVTFLITRVLADGVRLYATAIPVALLLGSWSPVASLDSQTLYLIAIPALALMTMVYTALGGVRAVVWTDVMQMAVYLTGAGASLLFLSQSAEVLSASLPPKKLSVFSLGSNLSVSEFFGTPYTLPASLLGGAFLSMASHGADQIIVQRLLTVRSLRGSQMALVGSGVLVILQFTLFLALGLMLYLHHGGASLSALGLTRADEIFPQFIINHLGAGLSGLVVAALLAAAMSTLSGSVNSLAAVTYHDLYKPLVRRPIAQVREVAISRFLSALWCLVLVFVALFFVASTNQTLVELALGIASVTYGGLLGVFLLAVFFPSARQQDAIVGFLVGVATMAYVATQTGIAWTWFTVIGTASTILAAMVASRFRR